MSNLSLSLSPYVTLSLCRSSVLSSGLSDYFSRVVFWRFWCKCCPWWLDVLAVENTNGTSDVFPGTEQGVEVECWLYNNHYSAEMAIRRGLSVLGPETLWLDFPCVAILFCPWIFLCHCYPVSLCIFLKQFNRNPIGHRIQRMSRKDASKIGKVQNFLKLPFGLVGRYTYNYDGNLRCWYTDWFE